MDAQVRKETRRDARTARRLNHVEFVHRPGDRELTIALFDALGCASHVNDTPPYGAYVVVDLDGSPHGVNDMFVSEAEPAQLALEDALGRAMAVAGSEAAQAREAFRAFLKDKPYRATHVGLRIPSVGVLDEVVARLEALRAGPLAGRLELGGFMSRTAEESAAMSAPLKQLWLWTDVFSTGLCVIGQQIELQAYDV
jgi:hypothetical protein